jgi:hypothetical protein
MPGSIFYNLGLIREQIMKYWYYGDLGQFKYNLQLSDKYLIEAKTLFEYEQYLLAYRALLKSDSYFAKTNPSLLKAESHGKNIKEKKLILKEAAKKHIDIILEVKKRTPQSFTWQPENETSTRLELSQAFDSSIKVRKRVL